MFGHDHRGVRKFDILNRFELFGRNQLSPSDFGVINFVFDDLVNSLWRQGVSQFSLASGLSASFAFARSAWFFFFLPLPALVISLEGDLEELDESLLALAN